MLTDRDMRRLAEHMAQFATSLDDIRTTLKQVSEIFASAQTPVTIEHATPAPGPATPTAAATSAPAPLAPASPAPASPVPGGALTLEQFNVKVVELIRATPNRGPAAKQMLTRYAPNGGGAPEIDPAQYGNFIAELEAAQ